MSMGWISLRDPESAYEHGLDQSIDFEPIYEDGLDQFKRSRISL